MRYKSQSFIVIQGFTLNIKKKRWESDSTRKGKERERERERRKAERVKMCQKSPAKKDIVKRPRKHINMAAVQGLLPCNDA